MKIMIIKEENVDKGRNTGRGVYKLIIHVLIQRHKTVNDDVN